MCMFSVHVGEFFILNKMRSIQERDLNQASESVWMENGNIYVSTVGQHNHTQVTRQQSFVSWV